MSRQTIKIGTRGSRLALYQANFIQARLEKANPELAFEQVIIKTEGDIDLQSSLDKIGGVGLFTKTIEQKMLDGEIDIAVHSAKDLPSVMTDGLLLGAVPEREVYEDAWLSPDGTSFSDIKPGSVIGTSSPRRQAQLLFIRQDLKFTVLRGNVETRIRKMKEGHCDAMMMARAGLKRLELDGHITEIFDIETMIPAGGQAFIAVQVRANDDAVINAVKKIDNPEAHYCLDMERLTLAKLGAGCSAAVGALAELKNNKVELRAVVLDKAGKTRLYADGKGDYNDPVDILVDKIVNDLLKQGAKEIIDGYE